MPRSVGRVTAAVDGTALTATALFTGFLKTMKLYYAPGACSMAPHIVLNELGIPYEAIKVDLKTKTFGGGENFIAVNGKGYVPVIELDNGARLTEVSAILQYLADLKPDKQLAPPAGSFERYQMQEWLNFISSEIHKSFAPLFNPAVSADWRTALTDRATNRFNWLVKQLEGHDFLMGSVFTVADAYLYNILSWARLVKFDMTPWPQLAGYMERIGTRPAVIETLKSEGLLR